MALAWSLPCGGLASYLCSLNSDFLTYCISILYCKINLFCSIKYVWGCLWGFEVKAQNMTLQQDDNGVKQWRPNVFYHLKHLVTLCVIYFSPHLLIHTCRLQPPPAVVLHDVLHHPARAPRLPRHERVQEEVRLGMGRVLPNCSLPDHSPCLLRKSMLGAPELRPF